MTARRWAVALCAVLAVMAAAPRASAHPHIWVTVETDVLTDAKGQITGVRHHWTFDAFFSAFAAQGLDKNGDGKLDREELAPLAKVNVESLKEFDYFTFVKADGADAPLSGPAPDYFLEQKPNGVLTLNFTLPMKQPLDPRAVKVQYAVYDPTFYISFSYAKESPVRLAADVAGCRAGIAEQPQRPETSALSEAFFLGLGKASDFGKQFGRDVVISCDGR